MMECEEKKYGMCDCVSLSLVVQKKGASSHH